MHHLLLCRLHHTMSTVHIILVALDHFFSIFNISGFWPEFGFSTHENCRYGYLKIYIVRQCFGFPNFRQFSGMLGHIWTGRSIGSGMLSQIWTVQSIYSGMLSYIWTVRSILSGMVTYMDRTVRNFWKKYHIWTVRFTYFWWKVHIWVVQSIYFW